MRFEAKKSWKGDEIYWYHRGVVPAHRGVQIPHLRAQWSGPTICLFNLIWVPSDKLIKALKELLARNALFICLWCILYDLLTSYDTRWYRVLRVQPFKWEILKSTWILYIIFNTFRSKSVEIQSKWNSQDVFSALQETLITFYNHNLWKSGWQINHQTRSLFEFS